MDVIVTAVLAKSSRLLVVLSSVLVHQDVPLPPPPPWLAQEEFSGSLSGSEELAQAEEQVAAVQPVFA